MMMHTSATRTSNDVLLALTPGSTSVPDHHDDNNTGHNREIVAYEYPEGGLAAWIVVAGCFMMLMCTFGMMSTVGVLQSYWEIHQLQGYSSTFKSVHYLIGMAHGGLCYALSVFLLGFCEKYYQFLLCLGILGGVSSALVSTPCMAVLSHWFHRRRGTATGIAMAGSSLGGVVFPLTLRAALERLSWAWALRIIGFMFVVFVAIGNICIRGRLPIKPRKENISLRCFTDSRFIWATVGAFFSEIVLFASLGLIPSYATAQGYGSQTGFYLLAVFNAGSGFGRWLSGTASDHLGRFDSISTMMAMTTMLIFILWYPFGRHIGVLYPFVCFLGFGTGSILSLTPVCIGQICKTEEFGQWYGTCYLFASFGTLIGIPIGGQLLQVAGPTRLVAFVGGLLGISFASFVVARWPCLDYDWKWRVKV